MRVAAFLLLGLLAGFVHAQPAPDGSKLFLSSCASCHGADGSGGEFAGSILARVRTSRDEELVRLIRGGSPGGMPGVPLKDAEMQALLQHLRTLAPARRAPAARTATIALAGGESLSGTVLHEGFDDLQIRTPDGRIQLLRRTTSGFRKVTTQTDWTTYDGSWSGNRYTSLAQIDRTNVRRLAQRWIYSMPDTTPLETTPLAVDGILYVTSANQAHALDAGNGRPLWNFHRPVTKGLVGNAVNGINRGALLLKILICARTGQLDATIGAPHESIR